jgi:hypothetical protein
MPDLLAQQQQNNALAYEQSRIYARQRFMNPSQQNSLPVYANRYQQMTVPHSPSQYVLEQYRFRKNL